MQEQQQASLLEVISLIIKAAYEKGCTMSEIANHIKTSHTQWKPTSASPAVSNLIWLGCVREHSDFGTRKLFFVRNYDPIKDRQRLSKRHHEQKKKQEDDDSDGVKMLIAIGKDQTTALTFDEAKALYLQLHKVFGRNAV